MSSEFCNLCGQSPCNLLKNHGAIAISNNNNKSINEEENKTEEEEFTLNVDGRLKWSQKADTYTAHSVESKLLNKYTAIDNDHKIVFKHECAYKGCQTKPDISAGELDGDIYFCYSHRKHLVTSLETKMLKLTKGKIPQWITTTFAKLKTHSDEQILNESKSNDYDKNYYPKLLTEIESHKISILKSIDNYKPNTSQYWLLRRRLSELSSSAKLITVIRKIFNPFWMVSAGIDSFGTAVAVDYDIISNSQDQKLKAFTNGELRAMQAMSSVIGGCLDGEHIDAECEYDNKVGELTAVIEDLNNHINEVSTEIGALNDEQQQLQKEVENMNNDPMAMMNQMDKYFEMENRLLEIEEKRRSLQRRKEQFETTKAENNTKKEEYQAKLEDVAKMNDAQIYATLGKHRLDGEYNVHWDEGIGTSFTSDNVKVSFNGNKFQGEVLYNCDKGSGYLSRFSGQIDEQLKCTFKLKWGRWWDYNCKFTGDSIVGFWRRGTESSDPSVVSSGSTLVLTLTKRQK